ncbi:MAG TPA: GDCCVxC domain-containing (seleno)protein [Flavobacteriales bacterium]|nr:GDCCVxC domain-containing (seleno)protein [Flavobacteriales bacterium]
MKHILLFILASVFLACNSQEPEEKPVFKKTETRSELTCPECKHKQTEIMPTDYCLLTYKCQGCKKDINPRDTDCCVFCSYGNHKCPSKQ